MGSWSGHTLPGSLFIFFGVLWAIKTSYRYFFIGTYHTITKRRCPVFAWDVIETGILIIVAIFGLVIEQFLPWEPKFHLIDHSTGEFSRANNWSHSTMYAFFIIYGISTLLVIKLPKQMPHCLHHITLALAFGVEGYLFYFHTHGREELDTRVHVLLLYAVWPTSAMNLILCFLDNNENLANAYGVQPKTRMENSSNGPSTTAYTPLLQNGDCMDHEGTSNINQADIESIPLDDKRKGWGAAADLNWNYDYGKESRNQISKHKIIFTIQLCMATLTILHGMWFWQAAYVLYPPNEKPWDQDSHLNVAFLTMFFTWYIVLAIFAVSIIFAFFGIMSHRKHRIEQFRNYMALQDENST